MTEIRLLLDCDRTWIYIHYLHFRETTGKGIIEKGIEMQNPIVRTYCCGTVTFCAYLIYDSLIDKCTDSRGFAIHLHYYFYPLFHFLFLSFFIYHFTILLFRVAGTVPPS